MKRQTKTRFVNNLGNSPYSFFLKLQPELQNQRRGKKKSPQKFSTPRVHTRPVPWVMKSILSHAKFNYSKS